MRIAVLLGGVSAEREVSLASGRAVVDALRGRGHDVTGVDVVAEALPDLPAGTEVVFLALHGTFGEDGRIQALLEAAGIPYTGSGPEASALAMDKWESHRAFESAGLAVPPTALLESGDALPDGIGLPCAVKPRREGSSIGVSRVERAGDLPAAFEAARAHGEAIVQAWITGRELTLPILEGTELPIVELRPTRPFYDYEAKYADGGGTRYVVGTVLDPEVERAVREVSARAFRLLGCRRFGRADLMLPADGTPLLLEVNTLPGMTSHSLLPMAAVAAGIPFADLCERMVRMAVDRVPA